MTSDFFSNHHVRKIPKSCGLFKKQRTSRKHRKNDGGSLVEPILHRRGSQEIGKAPRCHGNG